RWPVQLELYVHGEQVGAEYAHVDRVESAQRVPADDATLARERVVVDQHGGHAGHPAVAPADPQPHPHTRVLLDVAHVPGPQPVFSDDPEGLALASVADRRAP